jgi:hypothetical protein
MERENPKLEQSAILCPGYAGRSLYRRATTLQHLSSTVRRSRM